VSAVERLLAEAAREGVELYLHEPGKVRWRAHREPDPYLLSQLRDCRAEITKSLAQAQARRDAEIAWRVGAIRPHVPPSGPIRGLLVARDGIGPIDGAHCVSCGVVLPDRNERVGPFGCRLRCGPCRDAVSIAVMGRAGRRA
jgi:hypothetical protein